MVWTCTNKFIYKKEKGRKYKMKLSYKLGAAAVVAVAGVAMVIPNTTKALEGTGHIQFTYNSGTGQPTIPDPTGDSTDSNPDITSNSTLPVTDPGNFGVVAVTPLEFGSHDTVTGIAADGNYSVEAYQANGGAAASAAGGYDTANFVQFQDYRGGGSNNYRLQASMTEDFTSGSGTVLTDARLNYSNITIKNQNYSIVGLEPTPLGSQTVNSGNTPANFIENVGGTNRGFGAYAIVFDAVNHTNGVTLHIPSTTTISDGDYNATITWTLLDAN